jgi:hypothetical protein
MTLELLLKHLGEMFQDISSWLANEQVRPYHIGIEMDPIRPQLNSVFVVSKISNFNLFNAGHGQLYLAHPCFEGDVPIPAITILACDPSVEPSKEPPAGSSDNTPRTWACKRKAPIDPNPP